MRALAAILFLPLAAPAMAQMAVIPAPAEPQVDMSLQALRLRSDTAVINIEKQTAALQAKLDEAVKTLRDRSDDQNGSSAKYEAAVLQALAELTKAEIAAVLEHVDDLEKRGDQRYSAQEAAVALARETDRTARDAALANLKELQQTLLNISNATRDKNAQDTKDQINDIRTSFNDLKNKQDNLLTKSEFNIQTKAADDKFADRKDTVDHQVERLTDELHSAQTSIQAMQSEASGRAGLWTLIGGGLILAMAVGTAMMAYMRKQPHVVYANGPYSPPPTRSAAV